ncbi:MAG: class I SAM-dependent methyltransferase [Candidatus Riflebacteria bacterium]|nr:class I SAM-dependent methyltransferase [Candidatus Riflebacteria bacterium]
MERGKTLQLHDKRVAFEFYQKRHSQGYVDDWPVEQKQRIYEIISNLELPSAGEAIDFGCGNGVFTNVIKQALPSEWKVYGTDLSTIAVENARKRYPKCIFFSVEERMFIGKRFDFLFTHHVLEHVSSLSQTLDEMDGLLKQKAAILHVLPCGNEGSFERNLCSLRKGGIDQNLENRFFFEDEGHLRRLNTEQLTEPYKARGFILKTEYYSNQYFGAINWIVRSGPDFIRRLTNLSLACDEKARRKLAGWQYRLLIIWALLYPTYFVEKMFRKRSKTIHDYSLVLYNLPFYVFSKFFDSYLKKKALAEWQNKKNEQNGSEMYLFFKRSS